MSRLFVAVPPHWRFLATALREAGHEVRTVQEGAPHYPMHPLAMGDAPLIDVRKAMLALEPPAELTSLLDRVQHHLDYACFIRQMCEGCDAIVVTFTADVLGRAAIEGGRLFGVPVIHVPHSCYSVLPEDAWYLRDTPGDLVCAAGERDRVWWQRCAPEAPVVVTGNPLWDVYHGLQRSPTTPPTILWVCESGANAYQSPTIWQHRDTPQRAYTMFLVALKQVQTPTRLLLKARDSENGELIEQWTRQAHEALQGSAVTNLAVSTLPPPEVLPEVSLAVGVESNLLIEAAHLGIPSITMEYPGVRLIGVLQSVSTKPNDVKSLADFMEHSITRERTWRDTNYWSDRAEICNRGATDGQSLARVVDVVGRVVSGGVASVLEREAVLV